ncbi:hypothetical protein Daus18300_001621 [Diaporthe australafricana]|uniref:Uncharacterized protein n=1 Tax=Diaporthe australafricana TaxID=127596 RepID=A0ABR3XW64_9PEZI
MPRTATSDDLKDDVFEMREEAPRTRIGRVFSKIISRRRKPRSQEFYELSRDSSYPSGSPSSRDNVFRAPHAELDGTELNPGGGAQYRRNQSSDGSSAYQRALQKLDRETLGPAPARAPEARKSQSQQAPRSPPKLVIPNEQHSSPTSPSSPDSPVFQDLYLHDQNPLAPYHSPVKSIFTRELSLHSSRQADDDAYREGDRRGSTDSLGSNFTVEEEARIQAQIVKNLSMLGHERVGGEGDIVHVPQPSPRRYSWEETM